MLQIHCWLVSAVKSVDLEYASLTAIYNYLQIRKEMIEPEDDIDQ